MPRPMVRQRVGARVQIARQLTEVRAPGARAMTGPPACSRSTRAAPGSGSVFKLTHYPAPIGARASSRAGRSRGPISLGRPDRAARCAPRQSDPAGPHRSRAGARAPAHRHVKPVEHRLGLRRRHALNRAQPGITIGQDRDGRVWMDAVLAQRLRDRRRARRATSSTKANRVAFVELPLMGSEPDDDIEL
jgi:hypothetical protein